MIGRTNTGGGSGINFKVVGGTAQPTGKENLVWVNTETAITSWAVSPNQPDTAAEGMVWIQDGTNNGINIVKKNAVEVFPSACKQYSDGGWKNVEAHLFRNGEWVQFSYERIYLIKDGKIVNGVIFTSTNKKYVDSTRISDMSVSTISSGVKFVSSDQESFGGVSASCKTPDYDLSNIKKLGCSVVEKTIDYVLIGFGNPTYTSSLVPKFTIEVGANQSFDISQLTGNQYATIAIYGHGGRYVVFSDLWLE